MKKGLTLLLILVLLLPCAGLAETVVTSFYPVWIFALNLTEGLDGVNVWNMTAPDTGCLHDYQLQTGDMKALAEADVFLINGAGMEGYMDSVTGAFPELKVVDASTGVSLLREGSGEEIPAGQEIHHGEANAHIWLDPKNAAQMVKNLAAGLQEAIPGHAAKINENLENYLQRLEALDAELKEALTPVAGKNIVTFHEAFPYFAKAYQLNILAVISQDPDESLSPAELVRLVDLVAKNGLPPLFTEPQYEDLAARTVAQETGAKIWMLDPLVTGPETDVPLTFYEDGLRKNAQVLLEALAQ